MEKTLNDTIDGLFRGVVFIALDSIASLGRMLSSPKRGPVRLLKKLYSRDTEQVRPYVFLFLALMAFPLTLLAISTLSAPDDPTRYSYFVDGEDILGSNKVRNLFERFNQATDGKSILPTVVGSILGVTVLHLILRALARLVFSNPIRRTSATNLLLYVAGAQVALLAAAAAVQEPWTWFVGVKLSLWPLQLWEPLGWLTQPDPVPIGRWQSVAVAALGLWAFLLPVPIALLLVKRSRLTEKVSARLRKWLAPVAAIGIALIADVGLVALCFVAGYIEEGGAEKEKQAYAINSVECAVSKGPNARIVALVAVNNTGRDALSFHDEDFGLFVSAARLPEDPAARMRPFGSRNRKVEDRIGRSLKHSETVTSSSPEHPTFLEPGKWALLRVQSKPLDDDLVQWMKRHGQLRCTVSDANDVPAGGIGSLDASSLK